MLCAVCSVQGVVRGVMCVVCSVQLGPAATAAAANTLSLAKLRQPASEQSRIDLKRFKDFCLHAKGRIRPWISYKCHNRSTAASGVPTDFKLLFR